MRRTTGCWTGLTARHGKFETKLEAEFEDELELIRVKPHRFAAGGSSPLC